MKFEKKQQIEQFLFKKKQEYDRLKHQLDLCIERNLENKKHYPTYIAVIEKEVKDLVEYLSTNCTLSFPFGKYKDYPVDMILEEDKEYCEWYLLNVQTRNINEMKIQNYLCKKLFGRNAKETKYYFEQPEIVLQRVLNTIPMNMVNDINRESILDNVCLTHYTESLDNEFCYYGDMILDYGDFC